MKARTFSDVCIAPKYSTLASRSAVDLTTVFGKYRFRLPIISANMPAVTEVEMARAMCRNKSLGILHRFNEIGEGIVQYNYVANIRAGLSDRYFSITEKNNLVGVSIGVTEDAKKRFELLYQRGARIFCVDVAHGHHEKVRNMLHWINNTIFKWDRSSRSNIVLIAGNVASGDAVEDLANWGADVVKVGIGPGSACTTRLDTGIGVPQLYAIEQAVDRNEKLKDPVKIIADGGCNNVGDIAKALAAGADAVMLGSMLAGTDESPGEYINVDGKEKKVYYGSASFRNKQVEKHIEGRDFLINRKGSVQKVLNKISDGLQSAFSYVGANNLEEFKVNSQFIDITEGGKQESKYE